MKPRAALLAAPVAASPAAPFTSGGRRRALGLELAALHSLFWLVVANAVGLLLALLLLAPRLGDAIAPLGYGRWMALHLDLHLYGWCSLPLVGVLLRLYLPSDASWHGSALALGAWSGALAVGAVSWLGGESSGKPFLDWSAQSRTLFAAAMLLLAAVLAVGWIQAALGVARGAPELAAGVRAGGHRKRSRAGLALAGTGALLAALAAVPFLLYWAASPAVHPPINPETSGPTGTSLLGSTLGVIALVGGAPLLAGLRPRRGWRPAIVALAALLAHAVVFSLLDHGDRSHRDTFQIVAVASLLPWLVLLDRHLRGLRWPAGSGPWLRAFRWWWALLAIGATISFLPGVLDRVKFTNVLVAHAHVAMAGVVTSFDVLLLCAVLRDTRLRHLFRDRGAFWLWNGGNLAMAACLIAVGALEARSPGILFRPDGAVQALYAARAVAGAAMLVASVRWLGSALARSRSEMTAPAAAATREAAASQETAGLHDSATVEAT